MKTADLLLGNTDGPTLDPDGAWAPRGVRGADKVGQRLVYALMTPQGSVPGRPTDGSPFLTLLENFRSEFDVYTAWAGAEPAAVASIQAGELAAEPASEKYGSAQLQGVTVTQDRVALTFAVVAADGSRPLAPVVLELPT